MRYIKKTDYFRVSCVSKSTALQFNRFILICDMLNQSLPVLVFMLNEFNQFFLFFIFLERKAAHGKINNRARQVHKNIFVKSLWPRHCIINIFYKLTH